MGKICSKSSKEAEQEDVEKTDLPRQPIQEQPTSSGMEQPQPGMTQTTDNQMISGVQTVSSFSGQAGKTPSTVERRTEVPPSSSTSGLVNENAKWTQSTISVHSTASVEHITLLEDKTLHATENRDSMKVMEKHYERELEKARHDQQASKDQLAKIETELKEATEKRKKAEKEVEDLKKQSDQAREQLTFEKQQHEEEIGKLRKEKVEAETKRQELEKEKANVESALNELKKKKEKKNSDIDRLQRELAEKDQKLQDLEAKANILKFKENEIQELRKEKEELYLRLSAMAGRKLTDNNPNIADLSDTNRPTKLAEQYSQIYDNEWTEAFEYLDGLKDYKEDDKKAINVLFQTISIAYDVAVKKANSELGNLTKAVDDIGGVGHSGNIKDFLKEMKDYRRKRVDPGEDLQKEYADKMQKKFPAIPCNSEASASWDAYRSSCLKICWLMAIQDPPVYLECGKASRKKGDPLDKNKYKEYTISGVLIDFPVWPAMYLCENGSVLCKGVVQCVKKSSSLRLDNTSQMNEVMLRNPSKSLNVPSDSTALQIANDTSQITAL